MNDLRALIWIGAVGCFVVKRQNSEPTRPTNYGREENAWFSGRPSTQVFSLINSTESFFFSEELCIFHYSTTVFNSAYVVLLKFEGVARIFSIMFNLSYM